MILIDPPSPFGDLATWKEFLADMERLLKANPDNEDVREHLEKAGDMVASLSK